MKIEIEIPDLQTIYSSYYEDGEYYEDDETNSERLARALFKDAKSEFIDRLYDNYIDSRVYNSISLEVKELINNNQKEIIDKVVSKVTDAILKKKAVVDEMPKKSEITSINKEWEKYFVKLIDKAIAKRFK